MKKLIFTLFFTLALTFTNLFAVITGAGTSTNPYIIHTSDDLITVMTDNTYWLNGIYIELGAELDMAGYTNCSQIGTFSNKYNGHFDGKGFRIRNITIDQSSVNDMGLFGYGDVGAFIANTSTENSNITGQDHVGVFIGQNYGIVVNCYSTGTSIGRSRVGGFCGENYGMISNCYSTGNVNPIINGLYSGGFCGLNEGTITHCYAQGMVNGYNYVGGFCGGNLNSINYCYTTSDASGNNYVGGFCGSCNNMVNVNHCFSYGTVTSAHEAGGFISMYSGGANLECNFWGFQGASLDDTYDLGDIDDSQIKELNIFQFRDITNFPCFNFETTWEINGKHPYLRNIGGPQFHPIPTLTEWAAIIFISMIAMIGGWFSLKKII